MTPLPMRPSRPWRRINDAAAVAMRYLVAIVAAVYATLDAAATVVYEE